MVFTFIFDYDDTLAPNQSYYCDTTLDFIRYVRDKIGNKAPDVLAISSLLNEVDKENVKRKGFGMERFPEALVETFKKICKINYINYHYTEKDIADIYSLGLKTFDIKPGLEEGAEDLLEFLTGKKDELVLYTKGDEMVQRKKIDLNKLYRWFSEERIYIVGEKSKTGLESIIGDKDKDKVFKVGNSIRSDVNPALAAGIKVIYIPCETWTYEREHNGVDESNPKLFIFSCLKDIIVNYERL